MAKGHGRAPSQRQLRVGEELRHALAEVLGRGDLRDPGLSGVSLTVTEVRVSPDLRNASAFVVPLGGGDAATVLAALGRAAPYLRGQVVRLVRLKFAPQFTFRADTSFDQASVVESLLHEPCVAADVVARRDERGGGA
ncbi:MAG: 30S ribosome-binding factor RbfA [Alphaproteobacteria bacterium]